MSQKSTIFKALLATAFVAGSASALAVPRTLDAGVAYDYNGTSFSFDGGGVMKFSQDVLDAFELAQITFTNVAPATYDPATGQAGTPLSSITLDDPSGAFLGLTTTGGLTMTAPRSVVSNSGSVTITNLTFDMTSKFVYADISGANGLATQTNFQLFKVGAITGDTSWNFQPGTFGATGAPLQLTTAGQAAFVQGLGLKGIGITTLQAITDFGSSTVTITAQQVPEPSTYALFGLGFGAAVFAARRRRAR